VGFFVAQVAAARGEAFGEHAHELPLRGVGVLELVDEHVLEPLAVALERFGVLGEVRADLLRVGLTGAPDSQGFMRRYGLSYLNLRDNSGRFAHAYGTDKLPETFVIDRAGHVVAISRGEINEAFLDLTEQGVR